MAIKVKVGDVFLIPLDKDNCAGGQIVSDWNGELYLAVFEKKYAFDAADPRAIVGGKPAFLTLSLDALLWHGEWPIIGNIQDNLEKYPQPAFKVGQDGTTYVESRDLTNRRPATLQEVGMLQYRTVSSPALVEDAVKAYFGIGEWRSDYDHMLADYAVESSKIL